MASTKLLAALAITALAGTAFGTHAGASSSTAASDPNGCKVVHLKPGENSPSGALSSTVTAGNGQVSANSTGPNGVTVHSSNGNTSSAVTTTGSGNGTTTVTSANGNCTVYVHSREKDK